MMLTLKRAKVTEIKSKRPGFIEASVDVDGSHHKAICYSGLVGDVRPGDDVIVNTTAVDLDLGTGGYHFILWNLSKDSVASQSDGHIMKLRYTPLQIKCLAAEEENSPYHKVLKDVASIENMPVIVGTLHSQLPAAAVMVKELLPSAKIAYIMTDGAALPLAFSRLVAELKGTGSIDATITSGHAFGGDIEAINIFSALAAAKYAVAADVAIVCMGPGIVGSNTRLGFTGMEQGQVINAVNGLKGTPIAIPRISFADKRERHVGISHHTVTALTIAAVSRSIVTIPEMDRGKANTINDQIIKERLDHAHTIARVSAGMVISVLKSKNILPTTMGRTLDQDPEFFMAAGAAGIYAATTLLGGK
ncbi:MAG: DUF3866 family protein [Candidatus Aquicultor sp.]